MIGLKLIFFRCRLKILISSKYYIQNNSAKRMRVTEPFTILRFDLTVF